MAIVYGLLAYALFGVAMAMMKYGAEVLAHPSTIRTDPGDRRRFAVWCGGNAVNFVFVVLQTYAFGLGRVSVISAFAGVGLVVLAILSRLVLREPAGPGIVGAIALVVLGTAAVGGFSDDAGARSIPADHGARLLVFGAATIGPWGVAVAGSRLRGWAAATVVFGVGAGTLGGVAILCQKVFGTAQVEGFDLARLLVEPTFWGFAVVSLSSVAVLQVAYLFGRAVVVVPLFLGALIAIPVAGGTLVFGEPFATGQAAGVVLILVGIVLLARTDPDPEVGA